MSHLTLKMFFVITKRKQTISMFKLLFMLSELWTSIVWLICILSKEKALIMTFLCCEIWPSLRRQMFIMLCHDDVVTDQILSSKWRLSGMLARVSGITRSGIILKNFTRFASIDISVIAVNIFYVSVSFQLTWWKY